MVDLDGSVGSIIWVVDILVKRNLNIEYREENKNQSRQSTTMSITML